MERLNFSITIDAPKEKVWDVMLNDATYREWTAAFSEGSHYVGDWSQGSKILFLGPDENGKLGGIASRIRENRQYEYLSMEHVGLVDDGQEITSGDAVKDWIGAQENYIFKEVDGKTELHIELDTPDPEKDMFEGLWPKALDKLKSIAES